MKKLLTLILLALTLAACDDSPRNWKDGLHFSSPTPTPSPTPEPSRVPFYQLPTPEPASPSPTPTPEPIVITPFTPDPEVLAFANAVLAQRPWLVVESSEPNTPPGVSPSTTVLRARAEPIVEKDGDGWKITFKP